MADFRELSVIFKKREKDSRKRKILMEYLSMVLSLSRGLKNHLPIRA